MRKESLKNFGTLQDMLKLEESVVEKGEGGMVMLQRIGRCGDRHIEEIINVIVLNCLNFLDQYPR